MPNPNTLNWLHYQDIQIPDVELRQQFIQYYKNGQFNEALLLLTNNADQLEGKAFIANSINTIITGLLALENYYYEGVTVYLSNLAMQYQTLINNFRKRSNWLNSVQYTPYNFVAYNNDIYMCFQQPPVGTLPTNTTYWIYLGLKGIDGQPGVNVTMEYNWVQTTPYQMNDLVVYNNNIYVALKDNTGVIPGTDEDTWLVFIQFAKGQIYIGTEAPNVLNNNVVWFQTQTDPSQATDTTPIIGQFQRYLADYSSWDPMYPNTVFNWVENYQNYAQPLFVDTITIQTSDWVSNQFTYTYDKLTEQSVVDILPNGAMSTAQQDIYNNLSMTISGTTITLTSGVTPTTSITIRIRIIQ